jgi:hypothetical protein
MSLDGLTQAELRRVVNILARELAKCGNGVTNRAPCMCGRECPTWNELDECAREIEMRGNYVKHQMFYRCWISFARKRYEEDWNES